MTGGAQVSQVVGDTVGGAAPGEQVHAEETLPTRSAGGNARGGRSCPALSSEPAFTKPELLKFRAMLRRTIL